MLGTRRARVSFAVVAAAAGILAAILAFSCGTLKPPAASGDIEGKDSVMIANIIRRFLYYPTPLARDLAPPSYARDAEEVFVPIDGGGEVHALYWKAPAGRPTVLFFHGNAQTVFEWALIREDLAPMNAGLFLVDYPGYGKSRGTPSEESLYAAGFATYAWLTQNGVSGENIIVFGKSLGGGVTTKVASERKVAGVVLESTFTSIPAVARRLFPFLPEGPISGGERYDSAARIGRIDAPVLVLHGDEDELIPVSEGKKLHDAAKEPKDIVIFPGAGHNDVAIVAGPAYGQALAKFAEKVTASAP
ncbi:alpha/beta hydrolase [bacterium]|nr:alpha/beta hydrolase [bacterium]